MAHQNCLHTAVAHKGTVGLVCVKPYEFKQVLDGWFDHVHLGGGLVAGLRETRAIVEADLGIPAPWYEDHEDPPVLFFREGEHGGFASIRDEDLEVIQAIFQEEEIRA